MSDDAEWKAERARANDQRTLRGAVVLMRYRELTGSADDEMLVDLLTDLMHASAIPKPPISFEDALERAQRYFAAETDPVGDGIL